MLLVQYTSLLLGLSVADLTWESTYRLVPNMQHTHALSIPGGTSHGLPVPDLKHTGLVNTHSSLRLALKYRRHAVEIE